MDRSSPEGYYLNEVLDIEKQYGQKFPKAYIEFLTLMGKRVSFFQGIDYSMFELKEYKKGAECLLYVTFGDNGLNFLKDEDLVFISSQGCCYYFMPLSGEDNPKVYMIHEGLIKLEACGTYPSFTEFIVQISGGK